MRDESIVAGISFAVAGLCFYLLIDRYHEYELRWLVFIGSAVLSLRLRPASWLGAIAICTALTFNPFYSIRSEVWPAPYAFCAASFLLLGVARLAYRSAEPEALPRASKESGQG